MKLKNIQLVALGNWNPHIFTPQWLAKIFVKCSIATIEDLSKKVSINYNIDEMLPTIQILGLTFNPSNERLIIKIEEENSLETLEKVGSTILKLLPETPIKAVGINFNFIEISQEYKPLLVFKSCITTGFSISEIIEEKKFPKFNVNRIFRKNESKEISLVVNCEFKEILSLFDTPFLELFEIAKEKY